MDVQVTANQDVKTPVKMDVKVHVRQVAREGQNEGHLQVEVVAVDQQLLLSRQDVWDVLVIVIRHVLEAARVDVVEAVLLAVQGLVVDIVDTDVAAIVVPTA